MDDFNSFARLKINFRPEHPSTLKTIFLRKPGKKFIQVLVGLCETEAQEKRIILDGTDNPTADSIYKVVVKFDDRLVTPL